MHQAMLLAVKVLAKTMDSTTLTSEKRKLPPPFPPSDTPAARANRIGDLSRISSQ